VAGIYDQAEKETGIKAPYHYMSNAKFNTRCREERQHRPGAMNGHAYRWAVPIQHEYLLGEEYLIYGSWYYSFWVAHGAMDTGTPFMPNSDFVARAEIIVRGRRCCWKRARKHGEARWYDLGPVFI